jgi:hypothetical protein
MKAQISPVVGVGFERLIGRIAVTLEADFRVKKETTKDLYCGTKTLDMASIAGIQPRTLSHTVTTSLEQKGWAVRLLCCMHI